MKQNTRMIQLRLTAARLWPLFFIFSLGACTPLDAFLHLNKPTITVSSTLASSNNFQQVETPQISATPVYETQTVWQSPSETANMECVNSAKPGKPFDITIPDGMEFAPGQAFTKTWRLVNTGTCTWTQDYRLIWFSGSRLTEMEFVHMPRLVPPGEIIDLSVDMEAPQDPGEYQSNWKLSGNNNTLFGIGPNGDAPFWVRIVVPVVDTPTMEAGPTVIPTPPIFISGDALLIPDGRLDLDSGIQNGGNSDDIRFWLDDHNQPILSPLHGARLATLVGDALLTNCQNSTFSEDNLDLAKLKVGDAVCYRTNLGLPGVLKFDQISLDEKYIQFSYLTWAVP